MFGAVSAGRVAARSHVRSGQRTRFDRAELRRAVGGLAAVRADGLGRAARGLARQIEQLARSGRSVAHEVLGPHAVAEPWTQFPAQIVEDRRTGAGYFFHSHGASRSHPDERGHFHVFRRGLDKRQSHLVGIAIDLHGMPVRLFTTNRWVTGENWAPAEALLARVESYSLAAPGSAAVSRWITHCVRLFEPQLRWLVYRRDARLGKLTAGRSVEAVFEDRRIDILSECAVSVGQQVAALQAALDA